MVSTLATISWVYGTAALRLYVLAAVLAAALRLPLQSTSVFLRPQNKTQPAFQFDAYRERPFRQFLRHCDLSPALTSMMMHAVALIADAQRSGVDGGDVTVAAPSAAAPPSTSAYVSSEQGPPVVTPATVSSTCSDEYGGEVSANDGMRLLCRHLGAIGRFGGTAFLLPLYGSGELCQAFCRLCAVNGGIYMLRTAVAGVVVGPPALLQPGSAPPSSSALLSPSNLADAAAATEATTPADAAVLPQQREVDACLGVLTTEGVLLRGRVVLDGGGTSSRGVGGHDSGGVVVGTSVFITSAPLERLQRELSGGSSSVAALVLPSAASQSAAGPISVVIPPPPSSLKEGAGAAVFITQQSSSTAVCPDGYYVVHFMTHVRSGSSSSSSSSSDSLVSGDAGGDWEEAARREVVRRLDGAAARFFGEAVMVNVRAAASAAAAEPSSAVSGAGGGDTSHLPAPDLQPSLASPSPLAFPSCSPVLWNAVCTRAVGGGRPQAGVNQPIGVNTTAPSIAAVPAGEAPSLRPVSVDVVSCEAAAANLFRVPVDTRGARLHNDGVVGLARGVYQSRFPGVPFFAAVVATAAAADGGSDGASAPFTAGSLTAASSSVHASGDTSADNIELAEPPFTLSDDLAGCSAVVPTTQLSPPLAIIDGEACAASTQLAHTVTHVPSALAPVGGVAVGAAQLVVADSVESFDVAAALALLQADGDF